jgi:hypothetical protein
MPVVPGKVPEQKIRPNREPQAIGCTQKGMCKVSNISVARGSSQISNEHTNHQTLYSLSFKHI